MSEPKYGNIVGETWASEMWEWDCSGSKSGVHEWNVKEECNKGGLEENTEVTERVDHTLLGKREVSGLADHQISPLDAHDGYEIAGLSELEGLGGVANWVPFVSNGSSVEPWNSFIIWSISALNPGIWSSFLSIEHSNINLSVLLFVPSKSEPFFFVSCEVGVSIKGFLFN